MASRTQIVCLCEGAKGRSIDPVFINTLFKSLRPKWLRKTGTNWIRLEPRGGRAAVIADMPGELKRCGASATLMVWADVDDDRQNGDELKADFWREAERQGVSRDDFDRVVFVFAKDRLENWIEFLSTGTTDESKEGRRVMHGRAVADAAKKLADYCKSGKPLDDIPPSLRWSCENWRAFAKRMEKT